MGDPYWRYGASADRASAPTSSFPGYLPSDASTLSSQPLWPSHNQLSSSSDFPQKDILASRPGAYGVDDIMGVGVRSESGYSRYRSAWEDPYLPGRRDFIQGTAPGIADIVNERPDSLRKADGLPVGSRESNVLFVDALPSDCTRREVSHLFRPFLGFQEIRLVHKEPRHSADKAQVLCFVEFSDSKHAVTALKALQGYKFDNKKPDSPALRIHFAHFPFQLPPDRAPSPLQLPPDHAQSPFQLPPDRARSPFQLPPDRARSPFQLPPDRARSPFQLPPDRARSPFQLPPDRVHFPFQLPPNREEQGLDIPRERELGIQDEEAMMVVKRKFEGSPGSSKKGKVEAYENRQHFKKEVRKLCSKCNKKHFGDVCFRGCFICGKRGHLGRDCTEKPRVCYGCGEPGHKHSNCPKGDGSKPGKKGNASGALKKGNPPET